MGLNFNSLLLGGQKIQGCLRQSILNDKSIHIRFDFFNHSQRNPFAMKNFVSSLICGIMRILNFLWKQLLIRRKAVFLLALGIVIGLILAISCQGNYKCRRKFLAEDISTYFASNHEMLQKQMKNSIFRNLSVGDILDESYAPNVVYYVWCGSRPFEFRHYLSVLSVRRHIQPDSIIFYYNTLPKVDDMLYNTWYAEISQAIPFFTPTKLDRSNAGLCTYGDWADQSEILNLVSGKGGIYINESTIILDFSLKNRLKEKFEVKNNDRSIAMLLRKSKSSKSVNLDVATSFNQADNSFTGICLPDQKFESDSIRKLNSCIGIQVTNSIFPRDIWTLDSSFGRYVRTLFYGDAQIVQATSSYDVLVPNIAHVIWLGGGEMEFLFFLNVLSLVYVAKVDMVYIHGDAPPKGRYWGIISNIEKVKWIYRPKPKTIYGSEMSVIGHITDAWRIDFMINYGGIYSDTDAIFVKPFDREIRSYDAVGAYDWPHYHPFPNAINFGVTIGKRGAPFWWKFQQTFQWLRDEDWTWNGLRQPYRVFERNPQLLKIEPRLQVICFFAKCHPTWVPDFDKEEINHLTTGSIKDWRKDAYAYHWTHPTPWEFVSHEVLLNIQNDTMFSEIAKFVIKEAGMKEALEKLPK